jgi:xanthine/CO dehydrogenase XdhC/CoxF family maturation factor
MLPCLPLDETCTSFSMKETRDIIKAWTIAVKEGKQTALATVVHVEGSSYRRPGARMLVTEDGDLTGAISGGCLEGDALRKALMVINGGKKKLVTYDTTGDDDAELGVQLGCNGIVHILFEPVDASDPNNPVCLLQQVANERSGAVIATLFSLKTEMQPGTCLLYRDSVLFNQVPACLYPGLLADVKQVFAAKTSRIKLLKEDENNINAFIEFIAPPVTVVIAGAGNDAIPLVDICTVLGWETIVVDGRASHANTKRFQKATKVLVAKPPDVLKNITVDAQTVFVLMTHNYNYDIAFLKSLLQVDFRYAGLLGPKKKLEKMLDELREQQVRFSASQISKLYGPVGLNIGAETPEEIALSIVAEIKTILAGATGVSLSKLDQPIHERISSLSQHA